MALYSVPFMACKTQVRSCSQVSVIIPGGLGESMCPTSPTSTALMKNPSKCRIKGNPPKLKCEFPRKVTHTLEKSSFESEQEGAHPVHDSFAWVGFMIACCDLGLPMLDSNAAIFADRLSHVTLTLGDIDPGTAQLVSVFAGPLINVFNLLLIFRIVMSWYPGIPVKKFPFFLVYNPTEPVLGPTRKLIPPVGGVDIAPVIWFAVMSFINEILLGKQGLLVLLSQQQF